MTHPILIISGHDPTGGAGLIADSKTAIDLKNYPITIPSMLTIQTSISFNSYSEVQIDHIIKSYNLLQQEFSFSTAKIGIVPRNSTLWMNRLKKEILSSFNNVVIDPVLKATSSNKKITLTNSFLDFISGENIIITPNLFEFEILYQSAFSKSSDLTEKLIKFNQTFQCSIALKYEAEKPFVTLVENSKVVDIFFNLIKIDGSVHGTGCRFSTAIASYINKGDSLADSVKKSCDYMEKKLHSLSIFNKNGQYFII